jgi:pimeloyl-ACP methyl ester carboxylesterase
VLLERVSEFAPTFIFTRRDGPFAPPDRAAHELDAALACNGLSPPYLLVAASFAGFTALRFARLFPQKVHGLVLVDSSHPRQSAALLATLPADLVPTSELDGFKGFLRGFGPAWEESCALLAMDHALGDIPLIVLAAGTQQVPESLPAGTKRALIAAWHALQAEHAARSTRGELRIVENAGHAIVQDEPDAVIAAIADLLLANR